MILYEMKGVKQVFDDRTVLDIDHLEISAGRSYALLGPNGCGKTTLLHILAFLRPPSCGLVRFRNLQVDWRKKSLTALRRQVVLVNQNPVMFTTTVLKNVEYGLRMRSIPAGSRRKIAEECLERVGMREFASRPAHLLSGGETQRVAIARALACSPEVLLFDEPTAGVDVENQAVIEGMIRELSKKKSISVIFSTHKRLETSRLAQERVFLFEGKLTGPGGENLLSGTVVKRNGRTVCVIGEKVELEVTADLLGPARVFIKPEGIRILRPDKKPHNLSDTHVSAEIIQMTAEGDYIKVLLDMGVPIRALLSREEARLSRFLVGDRVHVAFEDGAVQFADGPLKSLNFKT